MQQSWCVRCQMSVWIGREVDVDWGGICRTVYGLVGCSVGLLFP